MPTRPSELTFGSFLVYPSRARSGEALRFKRAVIHIKEDRFSRTAGMRMPEYTAQRLREALPGSALEAFFDGDPLLVPVPRSGLLQRHALWPALRICEALVGAGMASAFEPLLERATPVRKSAHAAERPSPEDHYRSLAAIPPTRRARVLLVDDVTTRGSTALGAAWRLHEVLPDRDVQLFTVARTLSVDTVPDIVDLVRGTIRFRGTNWVEREP